MCPSQKGRVKGQSIGRKGYLGQVVLHDRERRKEVQKPPANYEKSSLEKKSQYAEDGRAPEGTWHGSLMALVGC